MLDEVVWCVSDPPEQARLETLSSAAALTDALGSRYHTHALSIISSASMTALYILLMLAC